MKKQLNPIALFMISIIVIIMNFSIAQAQPPREHQPPPLPDSAQIVEMVDRVAEAVALSEDQRQEVLELHFDHFDAIRQNMKKHGIDREAMRETHQKLHQELDEQVKALLNDEQKEKYEKFLQEHHKMQPGPDKPSR